MYVNEGVSTITIEYARTWRWTPVIDLYLSEHKKNKCTNIGMK